MGIKDLFITPIYLLLFSIIAYWIRPLVTTRETRKYFMSALFARFGGAIGLGLIYQFYYGGGDTFNYFTHGSRWIWEAFLDDPVLGFKLLLTNGGEHINETFHYSSQIWYYRDVNSYLIVRLTAFFDLFTFHTYSASSLFFAVFSFSGLWAMFFAVCEKYPDKIKALAVAILFIPTTVFWGSGILKDTVTLGALGWLTYAMLNIIDLRKYELKYWIMALFSAYLIYSIKSYILICYLPIIFVWMYWKSVVRVKNVIVKIVIAPVLLCVFGLASYGTLTQISNENSKYSIDNIARIAAVTAYDIRYGWGARMGGDGGYDLGLLDGTWQSMVQLMPQAINVSLFRPYLWEVRNPLMLLSALESLMVLILTIQVIWKGRLKSIFNDPFLVFCLMFSLMFAFAVGVSTYNFGTLTRYKIPLMPFYLMVLFIGSKKRRTF